MAPTNMTYAETEKALRELQSQELSILRLAEPVSSNSSLNQANRNSDASADPSDNPTPASFTADLAHYKELFSKLRFSYLEQVTKEKFLRAIVGDPPLIVEQQENIELEAQLATAKAELKAQKEEVASMTAELEARGRDLSRRYERIRLRATQLSTLPSEIAGFEETIAALRKQQGVQSGQPSLSLPLPATIDLLSAREAEHELLERQLRSLQAAIPKKSRELDRLESELKPVKAQKATAISAAREAMRRKGEGERGVGDGLEMKGRWFRSADMCLGDILISEP